MQDVKEVYPSITYTIEFKIQQIFMSKKEVEGSHAMQLRNRPSYSRTKKNTNKTREIPFKNKKKHRKGAVARQFGIDLTNLQQSTPMDLQPLFSDQGNSSIQIVPYLPSILAHITQIDTTFTQQILSKMQGQNHREKEISQTISTQMRRILVQWLLRVGHDIQIQQQTMHICIQLIDYVLLYEKTCISKTNFQLLGIASLFVACKYHQIHTYQAEKYVYLCDGLYTIQQLFKMESIILITIQFNLQLPLIHHFTYLTMQNRSKQIKGTVTLFQNLILFDFTLFNGFKKQHLAWMITYLALEMQDCSKSELRAARESSQMPLELFRYGLQLLLALNRQRPDLK